MSRASRKLSSTSRPGDKVKRQVSKMKNAKDLEDMSKNKRKPNDLKSTNTVIDIESHGPEFPMFHQTTEA